MGRVKILIQAYMVLCVFGLALCRHRRKSEDKEDQNILMQHAVKALLGFKDVPRRESGGFPGSHNAKVAPKFMLDLYHKYKDSKIHSGRLTANTVRSIQADIGIVNEENLFVVNLTSIGAFETVLKGEIHIYKKRMKSKHRKSDIVITAHELSPANIRELGQVTLPGRSRGWQALDVTGDLISCIGGVRRTNHMIAFSFALRDENGTSVFLGLQEFIQILSRPFLIVFSNDTQEISLDHIDPHFNTAELGNTFVNPESGKKEEFAEIDWAGFNQRKPRRNRKQHKHRQSLDDIDDDPLRMENELYEADERGGSTVDGPTAGGELGERAAANPRQENVLLNMETGDRKARSIQDNRIPEDPYNPSWPPSTYNVPQTHPNILQGRVQSRHRVEDKSRATDEDRESGRRGRGRGRKHNRRRGRKNREKQRKEQDSSTPFADLWTRQTDSDRTGHRASSRVPDEQVCGKRTLVVDFADIGWSDWIISPKSFRAQYCSGSCPFPIAQRLKPSNHATIQSLMHAVGINHKVPAPCCVPDQLSSVTLLFFDANNNVVLKNYPGMTVESCACR